MNITLLLLSTIFQDVKVLEAFWLFQLQDCNLQQIKLYGRNFLNQMVIAESSLQLYLYSFPILPYTFCVIPKHSSRGAARRLPIPIISFRQIICVLNYAETMGRNSQHKLYSLDR